MTDDEIYCCGDYLKHWHVYYCYAADGSLLYVGQSSEVSWRLYHHSRWTGSPWFYYCTRVVVSLPLPTSRDARDLERAEIRQLRPVFNRHHNDDPSPWAPPGKPERAYGLMPDVERLTAPAAAVPA